MSNYRSDDRLLAILDDTADWSASGSTGEPLCFAQSLRCAFELAADFTKSGFIVVALRCAPFDSIIVFPAQIRRLQTIIDTEETGAGAE
jgi:hypothetical protein